MVDQPIKRRILVAASAALLMGAMASRAMAAGTGAGGFGANPDVRPGPVMMVTAGQGGTVLLPYYSAAPAPYALTGSGSARQTPEQALRPLGPVFTGVNARILLPPATR
ncbi:MAG: hypothetical protein JWO87_2182 [Phycisphaerales bacterium]|jgi:hypothetical protein|nr:hypothetical protein [Phycisphaerales bacterium]MDB5305172.1 hypothetical protein [Phycisphaerales bacterium]